MCYRSVGNIVVIVAPSTVTGKTSQRSKFTSPERIIYNAGRFRRNITGGIKKGIHHDANKDLSPRDKNYIDLYPARRCSTVGPPLVLITDNSGDILNKTRVFNNELSNRVKTSTVLSTTWKETPTGIENSNGNRPGRTDAAGNSKTEPVRPRDVFCSTRITAGDVVAMILLITPDMALFGMVWLLRVRSEMKRCAKCRRQAEQSGTPAQTDAASQSTFFTITEAAGTGVTSTPSPGHSLGPGPTTFCEVHGFMPPKDGK